MKKIIFILSVILFFASANFLGGDGVKIFSEAEHKNILPEVEAFSGRRGIWQGEVVRTDSFSEEVVILVNEERRKFGLMPLKPSASLMYSAKIRVNELPTKFSHTRPDGSSCFTAVRTSYRYVGENIAAGQRTPAAVVEAWMNSKGHRENILNSRFKEIGIAYLSVPDNPYKCFWAQLFKG